MKQALDRVRPGSLEILNALASTLDPCSRFNGTHLSLVDLGMVDSVEVDPAGVVRIELLLDDPLCPFLAEIQRDIVESLAPLDGVDRVEIRLIGSRLWTDDCMTEGARAKVRNWRDSRIRHLSLTERPVQQIASSNGDGRD